MKKKAGGLHLVEYAIHEAIAEGNHLLSEIVAKTYLQVGASYYTKEDDTPLVEAVENELRSGVESGKVLLGFDSFGRATFTENKHAMQGGD